MSTEAEWQEHDVLHMFRSSVGGDGGDAYVRDVRVMEGHDAYVREGMWTCNYYICIMCI